MLVLCMVRPVPVGARGYFVKEDIMMVGRWAGAPFWCPPTPDFLGYIRVCPSLNQVRHVDNSGIETKVVLS